jgi:hypothetical protein
MSKVEMKINATQEQIDASAHQVLLDTAIAALAAYNKAWEAANLPKLKAEVEAGEAALSKFIAECNDANVGGLTFRRRVSSPELFGV